MIFACAPTNSDCFDRTQRIRFSAFSLQKLQQFRCSYYFKGRSIEAPSTSFPNRVHRPTVNLITKNYCQHRADRACRASSRGARSRVSSVSPICGWLTADVRISKVAGHRLCLELRAPSRLRSHYADFQHCETKERPVRASSLGFRAS